MMGGVQRTAMKQRHLACFGSRLVRRILPTSGALFAGFTALFAQAASAEIVSAKFDDPTTRYAHGVLGDAIEWGTLEIRVSDGKRLRLVLPEDRVFEDLEPRLADMDNDGDNEVMVVESSQSGGARLSIYDENGLVTATPHIGRTNRWLAPIGAADLDSDGHVEVAYIDRPHLAKTLRVWRFEKGALAEVASKPGLTNHRIGDDFIIGGIRTCDATPEMITVDANWQTIIASTYNGQTIESKSIKGFSSKALDQAMKCK